jgi:hypothetical protein
MRQPILLFRSEVEQLEQIEADRIAAWTYTEIREMFLKNQFSWAQIPPLKGKSRRLQLPEASNGISRGFTLKTLKEKQGKDGKILRLISIHIDIGSGKKRRGFSYQMNVYRS